MLRLLEASRLLSRPSFVCARWYAATNASEIIVKPVRTINFPPGMRFEISQRAAKRLNSIYEESKEDLRIKVESGGCHGFQYNMKLVPDSQVQRSIKEAENIRKLENETRKVRKQIEESEEFDDDFKSNKDVIFVLPGLGAKVVLDESTLKILNKTTLTYTTELIGSTFKIEGGNMKSSCGCGSSFDVEASQ